jgi:hypothetical protein
MREIQVEFEKHLFRCKILFKKKKMCVRTSSIDQVALDPIKSKLFFYVKINNFFLLLIFSKLNCHVGVGGRQSLLRQLHLVVKLWVLGPGVPHEDPI